MAERCKWDDRGECECWVVTEKWVQRGRQDRPIESGRCSDLAKQAECGNKRNEAVSAKVMNFKCRPAPDVNSCGVKAQRRRRLLGQYHSAEDNMIAGKGVGGKTK